MSNPNLSDVLARMIAHAPLARRRAADDAPPSVLLRREFAVALRFREYAAKVMAEKLGTVKESN